MAVTQQVPGAAVVGERAERAWRLPMGAVSPLWSIFGAAAGVGIAYWWMTQWTRTVNVEALAGASAKAPKPKPVEAAAEAAQAVAASPPPAVVVEALAVEALIVEAAAPAAEVTDDLTRMTGVGPKLAAALAARGVTRFVQIAAWTADDLATLDVALSLKGRAVREAWVAQAKRLAGNA